MLLCGSHLISKVTDIVDLSLPCNRVINNEELMKTKVVLTSHLTILMLLLCLASSVYASHVYYAIPGRSDADVKLGMSRTELLRGNKPLHTYHFSWYITKQNKSTRVDIIEDEWDRQNGGDTKIFDVLYINGKVIQIQDSNNNVTLENGIYPGSKLSEIFSKFSHLKLSVYGYEYHPAGGYDGYFYDDERRGVAFYVGDQGMAGDFPIDGLIVHRSGFAIIPPSHGTKPKRTDPDSKLTPQYLYSQLGGTGFVSSTFD